MAAPRRFYCPVQGCQHQPEGWPSVATIKPHLNDHLSGRWLGTLPAGYLESIQYTRCTVCHFLVHTRYNGTCYTCRPIQRAQMAVAAMRVTLPSAAPPPRVETTTTRLPTLDDVFSRYVPTVKHVPKELRGMWARCLCRALANAVYNNSMEAWTELLMLPQCTLCTPPRAGKAHEKQRLAFSRSRLHRWLAGERGELWADLHNYTPPKPKRQTEEGEKAMRQQRCIDQCREQAFSKGCAALTKGAPLGHSLTVANALADKHPRAAHPPNLDHLSPATPGLVPTFTPQDVEKAVRSFSPHSAGGPSGLRPIWLKDAATGASKDELYQHLCSLMQMLVRGEAPRALIPFLSGASLNALPKKDGSIRPIAVGEVWRRLAAKLLCAAYQDQARALLWPLQIGVAQPLGTEVGLQTARQWCERNSGCPNAAFVKIDFENAFNTVSRQAFLEQCRHNLPGLAPWAEWCYDSPSHLFFGSHRIASESGVQQGDPLGPLLFALALQPILQGLHAQRSEGGLRLVFSYLDDCCLAGDYRSVAQALQELKQKCLDIGLKLNTSKCELIPLAGPQAHIINHFPSDMITRGDGNFELLGGPIGTPEFCNKHTQERVDKATKLLEELGDLPDPQVALLLLRYCASFGKLVFSARVVPHQHHASALQNFDQEVHACLETFLATNFSQDERTLSTLSTKLGGLGLRSALRHSCAAFLASRTSCQDLCKELDPAHTTDTTSPSPTVAAALADYNATVHADARLDTLPAEALRQQQLSTALDDHTLSQQRSTDHSDELRRAHLNLTSASGAGQWLHTPPCPAFQKTASPLLYKRMIQRWLRAPIFEAESYCPLCDEVMDVYGDHCLVCPCGGDRTKRHHLLRNETFHICSAAGLNPELEKPGLLRPRPDLGGAREDGSSSHDNNDARRPADVYLPRYRRGAPACLDFAATSGLRRSVLATALRDSNAVSRQYEDFKCSYLDTKASCESEGMSFIPMIMEACGGSWGPEAHKVWTEIAKTTAQATGELESTIIARIFQNTGFILHRENARAIMRRSAGVAVAAHGLLASAADLASATTDEA